jgi:hypothetical protein
MLLLQRRFFFEIDRRLPRAGLAGALGVGLARSSSGAAGAGSGCGMKGAVAIKQGGLNQRRRTVGAS